MDRTVNDNEWAEVIEEFEEIEQEEIERAQEEIERAREEIERAREEVEQAHEEMCREFGRKRRRVRKKEKAGRRMKGLVARMCEKAEKLEDWTRQVREKADRIETEEIAKAGELLEEWGGERRDRMKKRLRKTRRTSGKASTGGRNDGAEKEDERRFRRKELLSEKKNGEEMEGKISIKISIKKEIWDWKEEEDLKRVREMFDDMFDAGGWVRNVKRFYGKGNWIVLIVKLRSVAEVGEILKRRRILGKSTGLMMDRVSW